MVATHRDQAKHAGRSLEEELRLLLTEAALRPQHEFAKEAAALREELRGQYGLFSDSAELIREDRDASVSIRETWTHEGRSGPQRRSYARLAGDAGPGR